MEIETILRRKGKHVVTIRPRATVARAVWLLRQEGIGALIVSNDGRAIDGIISERDIIRGLEARGSSLLEEKVEWLMTRAAFTCTPQDSISRVMTAMTERRLRHIPVVSNGALVGIVSIGDVVKHHVDQMEYETSSLRNFIVGLGGMASLGDRVRQSRDQAGEEPAPAGKFAAGA